jgi:hypothetical protein
MLPVNLLLAFRLMSLKVRDYLGAVWRPIAASAVMYAVVSAAARPDSAAGLPASLGQLLMLVAIGAGAYVATVGILWWWSGAPSGAERLVLDRVARFLPARTARE